MSGEVTDARHEGLGSVQLPEMRGQQGLLPSVMDISGGERGGGGQGRWQAGQGRMGQTGQPDEIEYGFCRIKQYYLSELQSGCG